MTMDALNPTVDTPALSPAFRSPASLARWLKTFLWLLLIGSALAIPADFLQLLVIGGGGDADAVQDGVGLRSLIMLLTFAFLVVSGILFCVWIYRVSTNARALGAEGMTFSPGWAVAWNFIPVAFLWKPYQAVREIWKASNNPAGWSQDPTPPFLRTWWFFWVVSTLVGNASNRLDTVAETNGAIAMSAVVNILSQALDITSVALALVLVTRLTRLQMDRSLRLGE